MTREQADEQLGKVVYESDDYQLRAIEKEDGLHVYSLGKNKDGTYLPLGFILGSNSMWHERRKR